jgi:hypothetical protein
MWGFFCNNGSLTGDTLLQQFDHVVLWCESTGAQVYGLVEDADNNAKSTSRICGDKKFSDNATWTNEELCCSKIIFNPKRKYIVHFAWHNYSKPCITTYLQVKILVVKHFLTSIKLYLDRHLFLNWTINWKKKILWKWRETFALTIK